MGQDLFGPGLVDQSGNTTNAVTTRPGDTRVFGALDTWFRDCSSLAAQDGTVYAAAFFNMLLDELRELARANGLKADGVTPVLADANVGSQLLGAILLLAQRGLFSVAQDTGTANAIVVALNPAPPELVDGMLIAFKAAASNSPTINNGATTLSIGGVAYPVVAAQTVPLTGDEITGGEWHTVRVTIKTNASGTTTWMRLAGGSALAKGSYIGTQVFATPGTFTYTPSPGANNIVVTVDGAGGAGSGCQSPGSNGAFVIGGGGGEGGTAVSNLSLATAGVAGASIIVGAPGVGVAGNAPGASGGTSSFGSFLSATGGQGGNGGQGVVVNGTTSVTGGGNGGQGVGGNVSNEQGACGFPGVGSSTGNLYGGPGGGSGGGNARIGPGPGNAAGAPGCGGGGGTQVNTNPAQTGGSGDGGLVTIEEYA